MDNKLANKKVFNLEIFIEIAIVLATVLGIKQVADYFQIPGAGSIGIWSGILIATFFMKRQNIRWYDFGLRWPQGKREWIINVGLGLLAVVIVFLLMGLVLDPLLTHFGLVPPADVADRFQFFLGKPLLFVSYLVIVIWFGAALGEELIMRGFLLNRLADLFGGTKWGWVSALLVHAAIFGSLHVYQGVAGIIKTAVIAIIFGVIYLATNKRLFPVILAHVVINTISITAFYLSGGVVN